MGFLRAALVGLGLAGAALASSDAFRPLGSFRSRSAAFTKIDQYQGKNALFITSFGLLPGAVDFVPDIKSKMDNVDRIRPENIVSNVVWPNEADIIPHEVFGPDFLLTCGGFLVPTAQTGEVLVIDVTNKTEYKVSEDERGYFYHLGAWYDVDEDGLLDIVTAKTDFPTLFPGDGKLVWFKNPGSMTFPWKESLLFKGPDVFFRIYDIDGDGKDEIVASIFVNERLSVFYNTGSFANTKDWKERVIDNKLGAPFDVRVADLNKDGRMELLVTNHQNKVDESAVFAYEIPDDIANGEYTRHVIAMGFETTQPGMGQASPGTAQAFYPQLNRTDEKPLIMVSGDGTQRAHLLRPNSEAQDDWTYSMETVVNVGNIVGGISVGDADNDGYADVFIPSYNDGIVYVYTFAP